MTFSVVIPTLDEASGLADTLAAVREAAAAESGRDVEVVVVDGGSADATVEIAASLGVRVLRAKGGRGAQLRAGALCTSGEALVFLHADTWLPAGAFTAMEGALADPEVAGGGFRKSFRDGPWGLRRGGEFRSAGFFRVTGRLFGDQAIFARRTLLDTVGGVPSQPLMDDLELCRRLRTSGRLVLVGSVVSTSGRRFAVHGLARTWWLMARVLAGYWLGVEPEVLDRWYRKR